MEAKIKFTHQDYEVTQREVLYKGVFCLARYHIRQRLFKGGWSETYQREVLERYPAAGVLPYDAKLDHVILIEQFRPGSLSSPESPWLIEIPAGVLTTTETPDALARREAMEEAGCDILALEPVCDYFVSPGGTDEYIHLFCGQIDARFVSGIHGLLHEHEDIRVINIPAEEALAWLRAGKIKTSPAIITLQWLKLNRTRLQKIWG